MAFRQFTRCVEPADYRRRSYARMAAQAAAVSAPFAALGALKPWCLLLLLEIFPLAFVIAYCRNWLYERLICLDGNRDVVGAVISISEPPGFLVPDWDNDYSINLLLRNTPFDVTQAVAEETPPYGELIHPHQAILDRQPETPGYPADGYTAKDKATGTESAALHCEFEGAGNHDLMQISEGALGFAIGAFLACLLLPFPADLVVSIMLAAAAFLLSLLGAILAKTVRQGSPSDVDPGLGDIHTNTGPGPNGQGVGADVLYVLGTWVYDPLHEGWNEIHPIKVCSRVGRPGGWDGDWGTQPADDVILRIREAFRVAQAEETKADQARPEHQWRVHPDLDACARDVIL
jgi:hypothetical protein